MPVDRRAAFASSPPVLCGAAPEPGRPSICARVAVVSRLDPDSGCTRFLCDVHSGPDDTIIGDGRPILLVQLACTVTIAGSTSESESAIRGAAARLQQLAAAAGLELRVGAAGTYTARYYPSVGAVATPRRPGE